MTELTPFSPYAIAGGQTSLALPPTFFILYPFGPALDDSVQRELSGLIALVRAVGLPRVDEGATIVYLYRVVSGRGGTAPLFKRQEDLSDEVVLDRPLCDGLLFKVLLSFGSKLRLQHDVFGQVS